ncbi:MAG: hypothetical protein IMX01_04735 [Limnochordaceae bacterium]|nr:hypothetical protein [Limnochordaceae bacterium]
MSQGTKRWQQPRGGPQAELAWRGRWPRVGVMAAGALALAGMVWGTVVVPGEAATVATGKAVGDVVLVDLGPYFNNDGVATEEDLVDGDLDGLGWSLMAEEMPDPGSVFTIDKVAFQIPETRATNARNNMVLYNQQVVVPAGHYSDAYFLATATGGLKKATITFVYADNTASKADLKVSDWAGQPSQGEVAAIRMSGRYNVLGKQDLPVSLYASKLALNPSKELVRIDFPEEVGIHLFALSLGTKPGLLQVAEAPAFREPVVQVVDLSGQFNQDGIGTAANPADGNFDGVGWNLAAETLPPAGKVTKLAGVDWLMPSYLEGELNNIQAKGQMITLPEGQYSGLYILATATGGGQTGKLTLQYADGSTQAVDIRVSDWCGDPSFGEEVALKMPYRYDRQGQTGPEPRLFRLWWNIDANKQLTGVTLPNNPSIHILAISLGLPVER